MRSIAVVLVLAAACSSKSAAPPPRSLPQQATAEPERKEVLPWIKDDLDGALAKAKAGHKPIFADGWALWCHACLSMQSYVLTDPALAPLAERFVWLAVDTEKPQNEAFIKKYPQDNYPTFFLIDPEDGSIAARWVGTMSVNQVRAFLEEGERTIQLAHAGQIAPGDPLAHLRAGDMAALEKNHAEAVEHYAAAVSAAPATWPRRTEALYGELRELSRDGKHAKCVDLALETMAAVGNASNAADFAIQGLSCADSLPEADPRVNMIRRAAHEKLVALASDANAPLSADDRGDIWRYVWDLREKQGDAEGAKAAARARLSVLDAAALHAPDPQAASTFDWARAESMLYLGRGPDAVAMLQRSEAGLPDDYNPPARLARVYLKLGSLDEGLAAVERSLGKAYGPRKSTILATKADLLEKAGRKDEARKTVEEQLAVLRALPVRRPGEEKAVEKRLESLR